MMRKMAFIRTWKDLPSNQSVYNMLVGAFPEYRIDEIDIFPDLVKRLELLILLHTIKVYGGQIIRKSKRLRPSLFRTPYVFKRVKRAIFENLTKQKYDFTFQTQSIFDTSLPDIPNFVYTDHTHLENLRYPDFNPRDLFSPSWIECERRIYQNATINFTRSSNISRSMIEDYHCDPKKVILVYCGPNIVVNMDEEWDEGRYERGEILYIGKNWDRKGGRTLLSAFRKVLEVVPTAKLTIIGASPPVDVPNIDVVGKIPLSEVNQYLKSASIFCLPTKIEPFGIAFLEALAHKLPILATNIGAIPDFVHDGRNGYLVAPGDFNHLADKLIHLLKSPEECRRFGQYGHELFWERYTWEKTGERIRNCVTSALPH